MVLCFNCGSDLIPMDADGFPTAAMLCEVCDITYFV